MYFSNVSLASFSDILRNASLNHSPFVHSERYMAIPSSVLRPRDANCTSGLKNVIISLAKSSAEMAVLSSTLSLSVIKIVFAFSIFSVHPASTRSSNICSISFIMRYLIMSMVASLQSSELLSY